VCERVYIGPIMGILGRDPGVDGSNRCLSETPPMGVKHIRKYEVWRSCCIQRA
jgi:hypothetical protein